MPLVYQQNINDRTKIGVWHITEPESFFLKEMDVKSEIKNASKRIQHLAGRYLLKKLEARFPIDEVLTSFSKKPYLPEEQFHFSISHSGEYAAAIVTDENKVGIDIELPQPKIIGIKHKFVSDSESLIISSLPLEDFHQYTLVWSTKEAVFKWYGEGKVDYKEHIIIRSFIKAENYFSGEVVFKKNKELLLKAYAVFFEGHYLVWVF